MLTIKKIKDEVRRLTKDKDEDGEGFRASVILLSSVNVGPNVKKIAKFTGYPRSFVWKIGKNLRDNGVWRGNKVAAGEWFEKGGGVAFICDSLVAVGMLQRRDA